eukprot:Nitzschia sp. Nitz4//scaffold135_size62275//54221//61276//NITZ4_006357-RA/size62275-snap-gene-0.60-mRNA-1//-1//CDS//3329535584//8088//frame0
MEQLVLGLFQEQLSKIIVDFRREQINANILNGKGEITDVSLNCAVINETVRKVSPFLEFEDIHVSRLGFHVTSWANLRKAPIVVDMGVITAQIKEPMQCLPRKERKRLRILTERRLVQLLLEGAYKPLRGNGAYGFADRILDNLTIEIESLCISFQPWGKFKTTRVGPWTPPQLVVQVHHLRAVSVDQHGNEASPDQVWAHNRLGMNFFLMYKKISGEFNVKLVPNDPGRYDKHPSVVEILKSMKYEAQIAVKRRLRDGAVLGIQSDLTIPSVEVNVEADDMPVLAHFAAGLQYCLSKTKSFQDPLRPETDLTPKHGDGMPGSPFANVEVVLETEEEEVDDDDDDDDNSRDDPLDMQGDDANASLDDMSVGSNDDDMDNNSNEDVGKAPIVKDSTAKSSIDAPYKDKPIILLPNGLVIYDNLCVTCSVHNVTLRGLYGDDDGCIQMTARGCIGELIWPKTNQEPGVYVQTSVSFMSVQEKMVRRSKTLVIGGIAQEDHRTDVYTPSTKPREVHSDENFPLFESRTIRDDPMDLRHSFPSQAFGAKTSVDLLDPENGFLSCRVLHEVGLDEFDVVLDAETWCRVLRFLVHADGGGYDSRWHTGDWSDALEPTMFVDPSKPINLEDHIQVAKQIFLDDNYMISSDLFNVTARCSNIEFRIPAAIKENARSCDVVAQVDETTMVVNSALPRTFLSGKIGNSISGDALKEKGTIDFPNDPSDVAYILERAEDPSLRLSGIDVAQNISTFRVQFTVRGFQVKTIPIIPICNAPEPQQLIAPMGLTSILCFEGKTPEPPDMNINIALFVSVHVHNFAMNIDFDLLSGAMSTLLYQESLLKTEIPVISAILLAGTQQPDVIQPSDPDLTEPKVEKSLKGRRAMVSECETTIWRQNVPLASPFRHEGNGYKVPDSLPAEKLVKVLKLAQMQFKELEVGVEFDYQGNRSRRTIVKGCLEEGRVWVCDVSESLSVSGINGAASDEPSYPMIDLVSFGLEKLPGDLNLSYSGTDQQVAVRLEEQVRNEIRSWSLATDLNCPTTIYAHVNALKDISMQIIEALLMPAWPHQGTLVAEQTVFPANTIGSMFFSVLRREQKPSIKSSTLDNPWKMDFKSDSSDPAVERVLRTITKLFLPPDIRLILLRVEVANLLVSIPSKVNEVERRSLGVHVMQSDLVVRFYPIPGTNPISMEDVLACKGIAWSTLIDTSESGYYQSISSRQSLLSISDCDEQVLVESIDELVRPFNVCLKYVGGEVHLSMDENLRISDVRKIEAFADGIRQWQGQAAACAQEMVSVAKALTSTKHATETVDGEILQSTEVFQDCPTCDIKPRTPKETVRQKLLTAHALLGKYEVAVRMHVQSKQEEVGLLKERVFQKERDRLGALALLSSRCAGWIRVGGKHISGQRVARKSTLWPFWGVLRKDLLILYSGPGEPKPSDVVVLQGASLRQLAGGRSRQDVKHGFVIVERDGVVRFFVTATSQEHAHWIREILKVAGSVEENLLDTDRDMFDAIAEHDVNGEGENGSRGVTALGGRFAGAKNRIGAALENARQKGREMSERCRGQEAAPSVPSNTLSEGDGISDSTEVPSPGEIDDEKGGPRRRLQFGKALSGMGQATKTKLGSAIQTARQKGSNVSERTSTSASDTPQKSLSGFRDKLKAAGQRFNRESSRSRDTSPMSDIAGSEPGFPIKSSTWTCLACTFVNSADQGPSCSMCGTIQPQQSQSDTTSHDRDVSTNDQGENCNENHQDGNEGESFALSASRRNRFAAIGAAVRSVRQGGSDGPDGDQEGFNVRRRAKESPLQQSPVTLKRIHAGGQILSVGGDSNDAGTLKRFGLKWIITVKGLGKLPLEDTATENDTEVGIDQDTPATEPSDTELDLSKVCPRDLRVEEKFEVTSSALPASNGTNVEIQKVVALSDIFVLHTIVSESVETAMASAGESWDFSHLLENVVLLGRTLRGFLDTNTDVLQRTRDYQAEILEAFLNLVVQCPLTKEAISILSELLGLGDESGNETIIGNPENNDDMATPLSPPDAIFSLLAACETELVHEDSMFDRSSTKIPEIEAGKADEKIPDFYSLDKTIFEPLIPPALGEQVRSALHSALVDAMAERDEAHAQLIASNVLHVHEMEQERRKTERMKIEKALQEEAWKLRQPNVGNFFQNLSDDKQRRQLEARLQNFERILSRNSDEELATICQQLAGEISTKTAHALEISRMKQTRKMERNNEESEKEALRAELERTKLELAEKMTLLESKSREAAKWKEAFETMESRSC